MRRATALALVMLLVCSGFAFADNFPVPVRGDPPSGPGWRLLSERIMDAFHAHTVDAATDRASLARLWTHYAPQGSPPIVYFDREIVALFGVGINSCTTGVRLDRVVIDRSAGLVYSITSERKKCLHLDLTGAAVFIVALDRAALPPSPFTLQLHAEPTCRSCADPEDRLTL